MHNEFLCTSYIYDPMVLMIPQCFKPCVVKQQKNFWLHRRAKAPTTSSLIHQCFV